jgi:hypothetical protein
VRRQSVLFVRKRVLAFVCALLLLLEEISVNLGATKCNEFGALKIDDTVEGGWEFLRSTIPTLLS